MARFRSLKEPRFQDLCFRTAIRYLLNEGFLSPARMIDAPVLSYDFSQLKPASTGRYKEAELDVVNRAV